jgi:hypothetical protein
MPSSQGRQMILKWRLRRYLPGKTGVFHEISLSELNFPIFCACLKFTGY